MGKVRSLVDIYMLEAHEVELSRQIQTASEGCAESKTRKKKTQYVPISKDKFAESSDVDAESASLSNFDVCKSPSEYRYNGLLLDCLGYSVRNTSIMFKSIAQSKSSGISFAQFLYGLGLRHIGLGTAKLIAEHFNSFDVFWDLVRDPSRGGYHAHVLCISTCKLICLSLLASVNVDKVTISM